MDGLTLQYLIIAVIFIIALVFMFKRFMPSKNKGGSCSKGCNCPVDNVKTK